MSAQPFPQRRGWLSALVAQASSYVLEPIEETVDAEPAELAPRPVIAVVPAAPRSGASTLARLLAAELALRAGGAAVVWTSGPPARSGRRVRVVSGGDPRQVVDRSRYECPVVLDLPPDGSRLAAAREADRAVVVAGASHEPALAAAVATLLGGEPLVVANRVVEAGEWAGRARIQVPDARVAARAAALGTRALGSLGAAIGELADALGEAR
jgi:hypothetical protein